MMWLHTFEGEHCIVAFNFAHEDEARNIRTVLNQKLDAKKQRKMERRSKSSMQPPHNSVPSHPVGLGGSVTASHLGTSNYLANGSLLQSPRQQHRTVSGFPEMLVPVHHTTRCPIPEDSNLHNHGHENRTSHIKQFADYYN
jgi:hypothetical protein